jgi:threonine dehydratase
VAELGSIVNSKLTGQLAARLQALGIPPSFQSVVLHAVTGGGLGSGGAATAAEHNKNAAIAKIATKVVNAAYDAFGSGLHVALDISGILLLIGALVSVIAVRGRRPLS